MQKIADARGLTLCTARSRLSRGLDAIAAAVSSTERT